MQVDDTVMHLGGIIAGASNGERQIVTTALDDFTQTPTSLGTGESDDHNAPAFLVPADKPPVTFYANHAADHVLRWRVGTVNGDLSSLGSEQTINLGADVTYAQIIRTGTNSAIVFCRAGDGEEWWFITTSDWFSTLSTPTKFFDETNGLCYFAFRDDGDGGIHAAFVYNPQESATGVYYCHIDTGTGAVTDVEGNPIANLSGSGLPLDSGDFSLAYTPTGGSEVRLLDVASGTTTPHLLVCVSPDDTQGTYATLRWNGTSWDLAPICPSGGIFGHVRLARYMGGATFGHGDTSDDTTIVTSSEDKGLRTLQVWTTSDYETWEPGEVLCRTYKKAVRPVLVDGWVSWVEFTSYTAFTSDNFGGDIWGAEL